MTNKNLEIIKQLDFPAVPILYFASDGSDMGERWPETVQKFAGQHENADNYFSKGKSSRLIHKTKSSYSDK